MCILAHTNHNNTTKKTDIQILTFGPHTNVISRETVKPPPLDLHFCGVQRGSVQALRVVSIKYDGFALGVQVCVDAVAHL